MKNLFLVISLKYLDGVLKASLRPVSQSHNFLMPV